MKFKQKTRNVCLTLAVLLSLSGTSSLRCRAETQSVSAETQNVLSDTPTVSAEAAVLTADGEVVWSKNADERLPMASTTKIMTALVAIENSDISREIQVDPKACGVEGSSVYLSAGETLTLEELLYALMLESANDAAAAIACAVAGSEEGFAAMMNETAARLELTNTHFMNPHGLDDPEHYTTARDLARLTAHALKNETFATIVSTYRKTIPLHGDEGARMLLNHNRLLKQYDDVIGVKTGFTKRSGRCLVSAAERDGLTLIAVTLNAPDDWNDHRNMQEYGFAHYALRTLAKAGERCAEIACPGAPDGKITVSNREELSLCLKKDAEVTRAVEAPHYVFPPVRRGDVIGRVVFSCDGTEIGSLPLYAEDSADEPEDRRSPVEKLLDHFR